MAAQQDRPTFGQRCRKRWRALCHAYGRFTTHFTAAIRLGGRVMAVLAFVASLGCLVSLLLLFGFDHDPHDLARIGRGVRAAQIIFLVNIAYNWLLRFRTTVRECRFIKWVVDAAVLLTLLPMLYPHPDHPWLPWLERLLYSHRFIYGILLSYSVVDVSYGVIRLLGRRTNPSLILSVSFLGFIFVGSLLLMMPRCTFQPISYIDALFVATSAVCITGLTTVDVSATFTPSGLLILALLIQTGGLGVMTFASFFALFFSGNTSIYNQLMVKDMIASKSINALLPTLLYILGVTLAIEAAGAAAIFFSVHDTLDMSVNDELIFSGFHSLSAFCNAGFSNIEGGLSNPLLLRSNQSVYLIASALVFLGGIGFPILLNFKAAVGRYCRRLWYAVTFRRLPGRRAHLYDLNTKIVLVTTLWVLGVSTVLFFLFEYDNTLDGMSLWDKVVQSLFNALVPRSSGFSSVNPADFLNVTVIMFVVLMWIGGASQSTAGGIKVNTFATMLLNLRAVVSGRDRVTAYGRTISGESIRRAHAVICLSIIGFVVYSLLLVGLEPRLSARALIYEAASALFTVGASLGVTPYLSAASKVLLCTAMFLGRVGIISLLMGMVGTRTDPPVRFPEDSIIIN